jgi:hypothetical protein
MSYQFLEMWYRGTAQVVGIDWSAVRQPVGEAVPRMKYFLMFANDLRIMGRAAAPSILVERSARAPLIWGLLQPVSLRSAAPALGLAFIVAGGSRSSGRNPHPGVCSLVGMSNQQAQRSQWRR